MSREVTNIDWQEQADRLFDSQIERWQMFSSNHSVYENAPLKSIIFDRCFWRGEKILLSYRKASLAANLDSIANGGRACFLCESARPAEQEALEWGDYEILINPYPADEIHFTIVHKQHIAQSLGARIIDMARLARALPEMAVFYNGPKCGASAPDHMHFQAVDIYSAENFALDKKYITLCTKIGKSSIYIPHKNMSPFGYFILDSKADKDIMPMYETVMNCLVGDGDADSEPMVNAVAFRMGGTTRIVIIPRRRHRPSGYGASNGQILVSPASLEMMGRFITSRMEDYEPLDERIMTAIYDEVAFSHNDMIEFTKRLRK